METITLKINTRSKAGKMLKELLELISDKPGVEIIDVPNSTTVKAIKEIEAGKGKTAKSSKDLFRQLGI